MLVPQFLDLLCFITGLSEEVINKILQNTDYTSFITNI